jgi:hypothetical protein
MTNKEVCDALRPIFKLTEAKSTDRKMLTNLHNKYIKKWDCIDIENYKYLINKYAK